MHDPDPFRYLLHEVSHVMAANSSWSHAGLSQYLPSLRGSEMLILPYLVSHSAHSPRPQLYDGKKFSGPNPTSFQMIEFPNGEPQARTD